MSVISGNDTKDPPPKEKKRGLPPKPWKLVMVGPVLGPAERDCRILLAEIFNMNAGQVNAHVHIANRRSETVVYKGPKDAVETKMREIEKRAKLAPRLKLVTFKAEVDPS